MMTRVYFHDDRVSHSLAGADVSRNPAAPGLQVPGTVLFLLVWAISIAGCVTSGSRTDGVCGWFEGFCFDATVNGQAVVPLQSEDVVAPFTAVSHYVRDVKWQLIEPISGPLSIQVAVNAAGLAKVGRRGTRQVQVVPLGDYQLASRPVLNKSDNVRIGGQAAVTAGNVLESNTLPPGNYLLRITIRGDTWDRKTVFVTVR